MPVTVTVLFWLAACGYGLAFVLFAVSLVFRRTGLRDRAVLVAWVGLFLHTAVISARWAQTGHPPFVSYFESMSASAWFGVLAYLLLQQSQPFLRATGAGVMPLVVLLMGWAGTHQIGGETLPVSLQSFWLFIHAGFATAAVGCFLFAAGVAAMRLYRQWKNGGADPAYFIAPGDRYDEFNFRLIALGFIFFSIEIVAGAVWADLAWGRYWGWDPIELWSLISWLVYAIYLHVYSVWRKLRGAFLAWYAVVAFACVAFSFWGIRFLYTTMHTYGSS